MHFHVYNLRQQARDYSLQMESRFGTDAVGIAKSLGLQSSPNLELEVILRLLQNKMSSKTLLRM
jgi:hypothetical protein